MNNSMEIYNLVALIQQRASNQPHKRAYTFLGDGETETAHLSYGELDQQARAIATQLKKLVAPGDRALLVYPSGLEFISAFFGCLYAAVVAVPVYPPRPNRPLLHLQTIANDAQVTVALTSNSMLTNIKARFSDVSELEKLPWIATDIPMGDRADDWKSPNIAKDTLAFLQYTSGSTGTPKGVMVSHGNLLHNLESIRQAVQLTPNSVSVSWLPHYHDMGLIDGILEPLYTGFLGVLISPTTFLQNPIIWLQAISRYQATHSGGPNLGYELCVNKITPEQQQSLDLSSWSNAYNGAEPVRKETLEQFATKFKSCGFQPRFFYPCYGMAEATLMISGGNLKDEPVYIAVEADALEQNQVIEATKDSNNIKYLVSCGHSLLDTNIAIVDPETCIPCPPNRVGEIWVSSSSVAQGYWNKPEATPATFKASLADTSEGSFLRTGDLGFLHDGELFITGRIKDVIIIWGRNHYPQDIEYTVQQSHPALRHDGSAAFAVDVDNSERLVIVQEVERSYLRKLDVNEIVGAIREAVSEQHELSVYAVLLLKPASIPKTSSGKIQRYACRVGFINSSLEVVGEWKQQVSSHENQLQTSVLKLDKMTAEATIQDWLIEKLADALKIDRDEIDIKETFASYGLDSSVALTLTGELETWIGRELDPTLFWEYPNIKTVAEYVAQEGDLS
ncbi:MAG: AMP-binding protein [Aphanothece sp. CMT-3BRIN-NPC111]|jgi:acyl-CoA synthetase (AMP-forming)/AMP-acid ligase II/acyl carrier protein|nr:AMP-binding protein [Aphanothece sp. CMT-3BRIN-NPC111]